MLIALSVVLVFGAVGLFVGNMSVSEQGSLGPAYEQMIHARIPWLLLGAALVGAALGVVSLVRRRRGYKWVIVPVELFFAGLLTFYFTSYGFLPEHALALEVGDPFPAYTLIDQDGNERTSPASNGRRSALYVFYRGDW